jgi:hypothetical protein
MTRAKLGPFSNTIDGSAEEQSAFATGALMPTGASAVKGGPMPGTWNWPPYAGSGGGMPGKPICSYVRVEPYRHKPGKGQWVYQCHEK